MLRWQPVLNSQETKPACRKPILLVAESGDQGATVEVAGGFQGRSRERGPGVGARSRRAAPVVPAPSRTDVKPIVLFLSSGFQLFSPS